MVCDGQLLFLMGYDGFDGLMILMVSYGFWWLWMVNDGYWWLYDVVGFWWFL